jgi:hypothetical protein
LDDVGLRDHEIFVRRLKPAIVQERDLHGLGDGERMRHHRADGLRDLFVRFAASVPQNLVAGPRLDVLLDFGEPSRLRHGAPDRGREEKRASAGCGDAAQGAPPSRGADDDGAGGAPCFIPAMSCFMPPMSCPVMPPLPAGAAPLGASDVSPLGGSAGAGACAAEGAFGFDGSSGELA